MDNIINPFAIYLIYVLTNLKIVAIIIVPFSAIAMFIFWGLNYDKDLIKYKKSINRYKNIAIALTIVCTTLLLFVPDKLDMIIMYITYNITYDGVEKFSGEVKDFIISIFRELYEVELVLYNEM